MQQAKSNNFDQSPKIAESYNPLVALKRNRLLQGFSKVELNEFYNLGDEIDYSLHDLIISENDDDFNIYIIITGEVSIWKKNVPVLKLCDADAFNETKVFFPRPEETSVRAEKHSKIFRINREKVLQFFVTKPERLFKIFTLNVLTVLQNKIGNYEKQLVQFFHNQHFK